MYTIHSTTCTSTWYIDMCIMLATAFDGHNSGDWICVSFSDLHLDKIYRRVFLLFMVVMGSGFVVGLFLFLAETIQWTGMLKNIYTHIHMCAVWFKCIYSRENPNAKVILNENYSLHPYLVGR